MIFIDNKYTRWYYNIITNAQARTLLSDVYIEKHHIVPKSLGGSNSSTNLVSLTAREHFLCHWMLTKMTTGKAKQSMIFALRMLKSASSGHQRYHSSITARVYESIKNSHSKYMSDLLKGRIVSEETKQKMSVSAKNRPANPFRGKTHTNKTKLAIGNSNRGKKRTPAQKEKLSNSLRNMPKSRRENLSIYKKNHPLSEESLSKIRNQYLVTFPNNKTQIVNNITEFCKAHQLSLPAMRDQVAKGKQEQHKGYKIKPIPKI